MGFSAILALQLLPFCLQTAESAILLPKNLESRQDVQSKQAFEETTARFREQGACRLYDDSLKTGHHGLETCQPKCGNLVKKPADGVVAEFLECVTKESDTSWIMDPDGHRYTPGECVCKAPVKDQVIDNTPITLPVVDDIGCSIVYEAFDAVLKDGSTAIPDTQESMNVGLKAAVQAAKAVAVYGKDADTLLEWLDISCTKSNYTDVVQKVYGPLSDVPDSVVPSLGCKSRLCARKKTSPKTSSNPAPVAKPKPNTEPQSPPPNEGKNNKSTGTSTKSAVSATSNTKTSKSSVPASTQSESPTTKSTKPSNAVAQGKATQTQASTALTDATPTVISRSSPSVPVSPTSNSIDLSPSTGYDQASSSTNPPTLGSQKNQETTLLTSIQTPQSSVPVETPASELGADPLEDGSEYSTSTDEAKALNTKELLGVSPTSTEVSPLGHGSAQETGDVPTVAASAESTASTGPSDVYLESIGETADIPIQTSSSGDATTTETSDIDVELPQESSDISIPPLLEATTATPTATAAASEISATGSCPIISGTESKSLTLRTVSTFEMKKMMGRTYYGYDKYDPASPVDDNCLNMYAKRAYEIVSNLAGPVNMVSAMYIPGTGVVIGSKPHGDSDMDDDKVAASLVTIARHQVHSYWGLVKHRAPGIDSWHCEDIAMLLGARYHCANNNMGGYEFAYFPPGSKIATYGRYGAYDSQPSLKRPCGYDGAPALIDPSCQGVMVSLGVQTSAIPQ
ncbi:MAG: hypothetical protein Q9180_002593 [Flavoplaca navasiana]